MTKDIHSLSTIFNGWDGYQTSIVHAVEPLTRERLLFRPAAHLCSVGEVAAHIALGRIDWFARMAAPGSQELARRAVEKGGEAAIVDNRAEILQWLNASWKMIEDTLNQWTVEDLARTYRHEYNGQVYAVSYQWTIWRILTHDIHHGGELALLLGMQGIAVPELGDLFGHLTMPPLARD